MCFKKKNKKVEEVKEEKVEKKAEVKEEKAEKVEKEEKKEKKEIKNKVYHVSKRKSDGKWQVKFASGEKAIKLFDTQAEAIDYAKALAESQEGSIQIHKVDGSIRKQDYSKK